MKAPENLVKAVEGLEPQATQIHHLIWTGGVMPPYMCGQGVGSRPVSSTGQALRGNDGFTARSK